MKLKKGKSYGRNRRIWLSNSSSVYSLFFPLPTGQIGWPVYARVSCQRTFSQFPRRGCLDVKQKEEFSVAADGRDLRTSPDEKPTNRYTLLHLRLENLAEFTVITSLLRKFICLLGNWQALNLYYEKRTQ